VGAPAILLGSKTRRPLMGAAVVSPKLGRRHKRVIERRIGAVGGNALIRADAVNPKSCQRPNKAIGRRIGPLVEML
jgi:hypothetical protein